MQTDCKHMKSPVTYSVNNGVLLGSKWFNRFGGNCHVDKQPLILHAHQLT